MKNSFVLYCLLIVFCFFALFADTSEAAAKRSRAKPAPAKPVSEEIKNVEPQKTTIDSLPRDARQLEELTESFVLSADLFPASAPEGGSIPPARIEEAELAFMRAWKRFVMRDYWQALSFLDQAQKANIFLVDVYYLRGLVLRKIGEFSLANKSISSFLEVRARDDVALNVIRGISENKSELELLISGSSYPMNWNVSFTPVYDALDTGYFRPYLSRGFGKLSGFDSDLCFSDTIGNQVFYRTKGRTGQLSVAEEINSPVKALFPGDGSMYVINFDGGIYQLMDDSYFDLKGIVNCDSVSDACFVFASKIAVADPVNRKITFYSWPELKFDGEWQPDESHGGDYLFEPVAVKAYANWLAAADRANGRIYFIDLHNKSSFFVENIAVRDIIWNGLGILLSINENSEISAYSVDFLKKTTNKEVLRSDLDNAWAFFKYKGEIFCSDVSGRSIWKITQTPDLNISPAFFSLYDPQIAEDEQGNDVLSVSATFSSPFTVWGKDILPSVTSVWNEQIITTSVTKIKAAPVMGLCFSLGNADEMISANMRVIPVKSYADIYNMLPSIWSNQRDLITNFILDSSIVYNHEELLKITAFCLFNGIKIDIWARDIPSVELMRASASTDGEIYFSMLNEPMISSRENELRLQLLLTYKSETSGYPDRSTLSTYISFRQLLGRDWIPIWIDAIGK